MVASLPSGNFKTEFLHYASTVKNPRKRRRLERMANDQKTLAVLERDVITRAQARYGKDLKAFDWSSLLKLFMPMLVKLIEQLVKSLTEE